ncbi:unnamed protein product [Lampetra planeri]
MNGAVDRSGDSIETSRPAAEKPRRCAFRVPGADESAVDAARGETDTAGCPERERALSRGARTIALAEHSCTGTS